MRKAMFALLALAISLFGTQCWAQSPCGVEEANCHTFSANSTTFTYNFSDGSHLTVSFVTVLTMFDLRVGESHPTDSTAICQGPCPNPIMLDPTEFPPGTVCVGYPGNFQGECDQYDFTGNAGGPNGVPVKNIDYKGLITLTLSYFTLQTVRDPAFGHAPGDITTFTEDILTGYSIFPTGCGPSCAPTGATASDPTMDGTLPGLSSAVPLDKPFVEIGDTFCSLTVAPTNNASGQKSEEEVTLVIASGACSGPGIRDKTARLSVSDSNGNVVLKNVEGNKFHWDNKNGLNEYDISTDGLVSGQTYTVTVFSGKVSPHITTFVAP
jgi:hypothetical protein